MTDDRAAAGDDLTRVWLVRWEWDCCGTPFAVGDEVDFGISSRERQPTWDDELGSELAATVDAIESHHEEANTDRVRGRVLAVHAVSRDVIERRSLRRPGHGAPPDAVMPADGEEWPRGGREIGDGVFLGSQPSRYVIEVVPVPGSALLTPVEGVRLPAADEVESDASPADATVDPPAEARRRTLAGWIVDVAEGWIDPATDSAR